MIVHTRGHQGADDSDRKIVAHRGHDDSGPKIVAH